MTQRFKLHIVWNNPDKTEGEAELKDNGQPLLKSERIEEMRWIKDLLNELNDDNEKLRAQIDTILGMIKLAVDKEILKDIKGEEMYPVDPEGIQYGRDWRI